MSSFKGEQRQWILTVTRGQDGTRMLHTTHCYCCDLKPEIVDMELAMPLWGVFSPSCSLTNPDRTMHLCWVLCNKHYRWLCVSWEARPLPLLNEQNPQAGKHRHHCDCFLTALTVGKKGMIGHCSLLWFHLSSVRRTAPRTFGLSKTYRDRFISSLLVPF